MLLGLDVICFDIQVKSCRALANVLQADPRQRRRIGKRRELREEFNLPRLGQKR